MSDPSAASLPPAPQRLSAEEVSFHPHSRLDPSGRVFTWRGGIYRAVGGSSAALARRLLNEPVVQDLMGRGLLVQTQAVPLALEGYELILEHRRIPFASYPEEWCAAMLKDAALTVIQILEELAPHGLTLKDVHLWNVLFEGCRPVQVDFGSIAELPSEGAGLLEPFSYESFRRYVLHPLVLMAHGQDRLARYLMCQPQGVREYELPMLLRGQLGRAVRRQPERWRRRLRAVAGAALPPTWRRRLGERIGHSHRSHTSYAALLARMRREIEAVPMAHADGPAATDERDGLALPTDAPVRAARERAIRQLLGEMKPQSVLDVTRGGDTYALLAAEEVPQVVAIDPSAVRVADLYRQAKGSGRMLLPLVMDIVEPTPARGLASHRCIAAHERLGCQMVLGMGLIEDVLRRYRRLSVEQIAGGLALFAKESVVMDYDDSGHGPARGGPALPSLSEVEAALRGPFTDVDTLPCGPGQRVLLFCRK